MNTVSRSDLIRFCNVVTLQAQGKRALVDRQIAANAQRQRFSHDQIERDRAVASDLEACAAWIRELINTGQSGVSA